MQKLFIKGKKKLSGSILISGSKNAALPILAATILGKKVKISNIPLVKDVFTMVTLLKSIGSKIKVDKKKNFLEIINKKKLKTIAPYKLVKTMRAGVLVLGPLLAKYKKAKVSLPGGCAIGTRPVDLHLFALKKLGAKIKIKNGYIYASANNGLKGNKIKFPSISVGATENAVIAAVQAKGKTILLNCAIEPEIMDLISFLKKMGCTIKTKNRTIFIEGIFKPKDITYNVMFDRIEAGTYLIASALIGKKITLLKLKPDIIKTEIDILKKMGIKIKVNHNKIVVYQSSKIKKINLLTSPYPGFPTDLQAQIMVLMTKANGTSSIKENIFENRFMHVPELKRMGAKIDIKNNTAFVKGPTNLSGAEVMATDLRASVSLVLAALIADNKTTINRIYHLDRGYEKLEGKLKKCKAIIKRI
ncbi:UDP-N-acetylglucosamine 1-carboxyvinyltransferase [Pelagibacteraceae bacterium]|jgi:UDP-N-acetylglucosamine 1-carboxyvinyltransferase|nr:UDP-N-acetylglucosamine 1-carboxyvinyltransferase [Pelagibacteraceae bacterium]|tara:strand:+ start:14966 stop:16216 length:1251 start_codon:yes stop_codon:yes gene_type:complete